MSKITVEIPDGYTLVKKNDSIFEMVKKARALPKTWEEFCEMHPIEEEECFIKADCTIEQASFIQKRIRLQDTDKNLLPTKKDAEGILALMQLIQLRDYYNDGWRPNWKENTYKYVILADGNKIVTASFRTSQFKLAFKTQELRDKFLENFIGLIKEAIDFI